MKRILIVDDEMLVRIGFRSIVNWEDYGFTVVGDACNGFEALEKIRALKPDLIFTDIKMDQMNGLELMKACKSEYPHIKFIVLSGYNDFENVRQSMRLGALDYVFKLDVKPNQIIKLLSEIELEDPETNSNETSNKYAMRTSIIRRIISGELESEEAEKQFLQLYPNVNLKKFFRLITVSIDDYQLRHAQQRLSQSSILAIENILEEVFEQNVIICPLQADRTLLIWQNEDLEALAKLQMAYARAEEYIKRYLNESITSVMSDVQKSLSGLHTAYKQNEETLTYRYLLDPGRIHSYHNVKHEEWTESPVGMNMLEAALSTHNIDQISNVCSSTFSKITKRRGFPLQKLRVHLLDMLFAIKRVYPDIATWTDNDGHTLTELVQHSDRLITVRTGFEQALSVYSGVENKSQRPEIQQILKYIKEYPTEDIKVSRAAEITRLSESYFAHIFKREMGMSFVDWLNRYRIEQARKMLCYSDKRINEIAESVGIDNANYFSSLYKKITGRTPMQERRLAKQNCEEMAEN
ncbi:MAG: response regulator [Eubacteriales bacterium]|nr:response regulator [Eubacteriales bacterium]